MADSLITIQIELTQIILPIIIVLGALGNGLNIFILTKPSFNGHACSLYFLVLSINNFFYSTVLLMFNLLSDGYQISLAGHSRTACKLISYFLNVCPCISVYLIVFASVDRFCGSSFNERQRNFSSVRIARIIIILLVSLLAIFQIGILLTFDLQQLDKLRCAPNTNTIFKQSFIIAQVIIFAIIAPFLMIVFGCLTIYNINHLQISQVVVTGRRIEKQLIKMLLIQIIIHLILTLPFCSLFLMSILPIK
ncbi:unnamed protein product, partial [Rotaria sp. Silwood2]